MSASASAVAVSAYTSIDAQLSVPETAPSPGNLPVTEENLIHPTVLPRCRDLLRGPANFKAFVFHVDGREYEAKGAGLEGFWYTLSRELRGTRHTDEQLSGQLGDYLDYLDDLFSRTKFDHSRENLAEFRKTLPEGEEGFRRLCSTLEPMVEEARAQVKDLDQARWLRKARIYHVNVRSHNLPELRARRGQSYEDGLSYFAQLNFEDFCWKGPDGRLLQFCDVIRPMGIYPLGKVNRKGSGDGSPFAISNPGAADSYWGTSEEIREKVNKLADGNGTCIRTMFEFVPNHLAPDCTLLTDLMDPSYFIHTKREPEDPENYYEWSHPDTGDRYWIRHGGYCDNSGRHYFHDVLQLNLMSRKTRDFLLGTLTGLIEQYGVHAFRVDMAHHILRGVFRHTWGEDLNRAREEGLFPPEDEVDSDFQTELISGIKRAFPHVGFAAEAFSGYEDLAEAGYDVIYASTDMEVRGKERRRGWRDRLLSRDPAAIQGAIEQFAYDSWAVGGAAPLIFIGNHDLPPPTDDFGEWLYGAALLTFTNPVPAMLQAGTEVAFQRPDPEDRKVVSFNLPNEEIQIKWDEIASPLAAHILRCNWRIYRLREIMGNELEMRPLRSRPADAGWVGYVICAPDCGPSDSKALVLANPTNERLFVEINEPSLGIQFSTDLAPCGIHGEKMVILGE